VLEAITASTPEEMRMEGFYNWTSPLVRKMIQEKYGVEYSDKGMREVMYRLGLSFTMPTYRLEKADLEAQLDFIEDFDKVKKNSRTMK